MQTVQHRRGRIFFENTDEFTEKSKNLTDQYGNQAEEFEIDLIDVTMQHCLVLVLLTKLI